VTTTVHDDSAEAQRLRLGGIRERLAASRLVRSGGLVRRQLLDDGSVQALAADALAAHAGAEEAHVEDGAGRGRGDPDRWLESAAGGDALDLFMRSDRLLTALREETGVAWAAAGPGTWSYYRSEGHHLGLHRDVAVCDLAVITCVLDEGGSGESGLLRVWPGRARDSVESIREDPRGYVDVRAAAGDTILLLGGLVAHRVLPLGPGHLRIVAPICYQPKPRVPIP
jgi:hypothetical protein